MNILIVIDMQNDFIEGSLSTYNSINIIDYVKYKINSFNGEIIYTMDTHSKNYLKTEEGKNLPIPHCIKHTKGWEIKEGLYKKGSKVFEKDAFASKKMISYLEKLNKHTKIEKIEIIGLCTDICVISNTVLVKTFLPNIPLFIDSKGCSGTSLENHNNALNAMKQFHINIL